MSALTDEKRYQYTSRFLTHASICRRRTAGGLSLAAYQRLIRDSSIYFFYIYPVIFQLSFTLQHFFSPLLPLGLKNNEMFVSLFSKAVVLLTICRLGEAIGHYDADQCCLIALKESAFTPTLNGLGKAIPFDRYKCGQQFDKNISSVPEVFVNYTFCSTRCSGWGLSEWSELAQWAAPLVQFILPSLIFSMVIPRQQKIELGKLACIKFPIVQQQTWIRWILQLINLIIFAIKSILLLPLVFFVDNVVWMTIIISGAGPMLIGGLYEAVLDSRLIQYMRSQRQSGGGLNTQDKIKLLTALVSGNLILDIGDPQETLAGKLSMAENHDRHTTEDERLEMIKTRLLCMMSSQLSFGSAVGAPVVFYLGQFVYTILDLLGKRGEQDAGNSLAFGVEWMVIVHVAIISGCLLASNNPSTSTAIVGLPPDTRQPLRRASTLLDRNRRPKSYLMSFKEWLGLTRESHRIRHLPLFHPAYDTRFQPVWLWNRGINKMRWLERSHALSNQLFIDRFKLTTFDWIIYIIIPTIVLIILPPGAGGVVSYATPPVGFACRSLSFVTYASLQSVLGLISLLRYFFEDKGFLKEHPRWKLFFSNVTLTISVILTLGSAFTFIGGTMMQVMGVYRNCFCYVIASEWWKIMLHNWDPGYVINVAVDTQDLRNSSQNWIHMGTVATGSMAVACYVGYWYQRLLRERFVTEVENLYPQPIGDQDGYGQIPNRDAIDNQSVHRLHAPEPAASTSSFLSADQEISARNPVRRANSSMLAPSSSRQSAGFSLREYELEEIGASRFASVTT